MYTKGGISNPPGNEGFPMSGHNEFGSVDEAFEAKMPPHLVCPVCQEGQLDVLRAEFSFRPHVSAGSEPIDAVGQVCVRCGFLAMHASEYLLVKSPENA
jgi:hypothetical protein